MQNSRILTRFLTRQVVSRKLSSKSPHAEFPSMNELPSPKGDWKTNYDALNRKYTMHLLMGVTVFVGTLIFGKVSGALDMYNDYPTPADIDNYKS